MMRIKDKIAIITGAGKGIGNAIALKLAQEGAHTILVDISSTHIENLAERIRNIDPDSLPIRADVSNREEVSEMVEKSYKCFNRIDILINNAGIWENSLLQKMKEESWDRVIKVNLNGAFNCTQLVSKYMIKQRYGKIINISSIGVKGNIGIANYSASKAGIESLTKCTALELAKYNINVNCIAPGLIDTDLLRTTPKGYLDNLLKRVPLGKMGKPIDIGNCVLFLVSEDSCYITGQTIYVCGGLSVGY